MRDLIVVVVILGLVVGGSFWTHGFYEKTRDEFDEKLNTLSETIETEVDKEGKIKEVENFWKSKEDILIVFQEHDTIDDIENHLYECFHYYRINEKEHFDLSKAGVMKGMDDLVKREHLTLVNLF